MALIKVEKKSGVDKIQTNATHIARGCFENSRPKMPKSTTTWMEYFQNDRDAVFFLRRPLHSSANKIVVNN